MALAILTYEGSNQGSCQFTADTGTNSFYKYVIAKTKTAKNGLMLADEINHESKLLKSETTGIFDSSFLLEIPSGLFKQNGNYIQLISYKDLRGRSPAFSDVIEVFEVAELITDATSALGFSKSISNTFRIPLSSCRSVSFNYRQAPVSRNLFCRSLINAARDIKLNEVEDLRGQQIRSIINKASKKLQQESRRNASVLRPGMSINSTALHAAKSVTTTSSPSYSELSDNKQGKTDNFGVCEHTSFSVSQKGVKSDSLSSLLRPALQQSPQLFQVGTDNPLKLINAVTERNYANKQFAYNYFEKLLSDMGRKSLLDELLTSGALMQRHNAVSMNFSRSNNVSISFLQKDPLEVQGKPKFIYLATSGITLKLSVNSTTETNELASFPKVIIQLMIKDSISMQLLVEKKFKIKDVFMGSEIPLKVTQEELNKLPKNKDLLISSTFIWQSNETNQNIGTFSNFFIFLSDGFILKEMGSAVTEEKPLNDVVAHRNFWHKVWEGGGNNKRWELELDSKYLCIYKYDAETNGRMETLMKVDEDKAADEDRLMLFGKMKSGLEVSPLELNKIMPSLGDFPSLSTEHLKALMTDDLEKLMNQEANVRIELKGKKDERGVLWAYPELTVHELKLQKVKGTNQDGQVTITEDQMVYFPRVSSFHFLGAKTN